MKKLNYLNEYFLLFCLDCAFIILSNVLKLYTNDVILLGMIVFYIYLLKNTFISGMHLTKGYVSSLVVVSIVCIFIGCIPISENMIMTLQLFCSSFISTYLNNIYEKEETYQLKRRMNQLNRKRNSSKTLGIYK